MNSTTPVVVVGLSNAKAAACGGGHVCGLKSNGGITCWGANDDDQLADGTVTNRHTPVQPDSRLVSGFSMVVSATSSSCAMGGQGDLYCWGALGGSGPDTVEEIGNFSAPPAQVAAGGGNVCVIDTNGAALCKGGNNDGELGDGTYNSSTAFVRVVEN